MAEQMPQDKRVENVKERLQDDLVDEHGQPAAEIEVARAVDAAAEPLAEAPVQEFTPLLIEHQARDALREQGLHRDLGDDDTAPPVDETTSDDASDRPALHLSTQQGLATPEPD